MGFDGFTDKDFDTYKLAGRGSATFTLARRTVKDKLRALMVDVAKAMGDAGKGMELVFSSEAPSLENNRSVAEQGAYFIRGASDRMAVKALVEKMSLRSSTALDVSEFHKHASIGVVVDEHGVFAALNYHPRGQVDRQNLKAKLAESWALDAFLTTLQGLPEGFTVQLPGMTAPVDRAAITRENVEEGCKALDGDTVCTVVKLRARDVAKGPLADAIAEDIKALLPVYAFGAWTAEHDHIQAVKAAKQQREESRKGTDLKAGAKVRILAGIWNGHTGVVEAVDKKGGLHVRVGLVSVRLDAKDAAAAS
jgi:hypothetical protein